MIEQLMCEFRIETETLCETFDISSETVLAMLRAASHLVEDRLKVTASGLSVPPEMRPLARLIARAFDGFEMHENGHSPAI